MDGWQVFTLVFIILPICLILIGGSALWIIGARKGRRGMKWAGILIVLGTLGAIAFEMMTTNVRYEAVE